MFESFSNNGGSGAPRKIYAFLGNKVYFFGHTINTLICGGGHMFESFLITGVRGRSPRETITAFGGHKIFFGHTINTLMSLILGRKNDIPGGKKRKRRGVKTNVILSRHLPPWDVKKVPLKALIWRSSEAQNFSRIDEEILLAMRWVIFKAFARTTF